MLQSGNHATKANIFDEDVYCPVCRTDRYLMPDLKLLVSPCYHKMCESCIDRLFSSGPAPCPICQQILRKNQFVSQIFEDLTVEKEVRIRKRISKIYNMRREDFSSLRTFNDYLEEVESITFNLMNEVDVAETEAKIRQYEMENKDSIATNQVRQMNSQREREYKDSVEKQKKDEHRREYIRQLEEEERLKKKEEADLISELATSNKSAQAVIASHQQIVLKRSSATRKQNEKSASSHYAMPSWITSVMDTDHEISQVDEDFDPLGLEYMYTAVQVRDHYKDPATDYLATSRAARAGGYLARHAHQRALIDAMSGLEIMLVD